MQGLLNLRHLQEEQVKGNLAAANADLNQIDQKFKATRSRLDNMAAASGSDLAVAAAIHSAVWIQIRERIARREYAETVMEQCQQEWGGAKQLATTLEKLENRHNKAVLADNSYKEQVVLDEIASQRGSAPDATDDTKTRLCHGEIETVRGHQWAWMK